MAALFLPFEGIAGPSIFDKCVGVVRTGSPVAAGVDEFFFGDEMLAVSALKLFIFNLVIASFSE
jgi:hypothetical protein